MRARTTLTGCTRADLAEVAALALETLVRDRLAGRPSNATPPDLTVTARDSLASLGLELAKLWVGDA